MVDVTDSRGLEIERLEQENRRLRKALQDIRDSTYKSALMLRAEAERALSCA